MDVVTLSMAKAYTDSQRLAYTEGGKIMWDVELVPMEGTGFTYFQESNTDQTVLSVGKTYTVTTDSGSFTTVCKEMSGVVFLGNGSILGITGVEDSGENFLVAVDEDHVMGFFDFNGGSRMEISTAATIQPIDLKFLPGVCLPVLLDLTKYDANGPSLNDLVLSLFSIGGGKTSVNNTDGIQAFWKDVNTDGRIQLMIDAASVKIVSDLKSTTLEPDGKTLIAIETSFLIQSAGQTARVTVMFGALSHTTDITLVVEFLTITG